jgi:hypothetical protein
MKFTLKAMSSRTIRIVILLDARINTTLGWIMIKNFCNYFQANDETLFYAANFRSAGLKNSSRDAENLHGIP